MTGLAVASQYTSTVEEISEETRCQLELAWGGVRQHKVLDRSAGFLQMPTLETLLPGPSKYKRDPEQVGRAMGQPCLGHSSNSVSWPGVPPAVAPGRWNAMLLVPRFPLLI